MCQKCNKMEQILNFVSLLSLYVRYHIERDSLTQLTGVRH